MKKKILFLHHGEGVGGAPISMIKTIKCLDSEIYDAEVLLLKDSVVKQMLVNEGIKVSVVTDKFYKNHYKFFSHIEPAYYRFWELRTLLRVMMYWIFSRYYFSHRLLSGYDFDLLHLNSSVLTDFMAAGAKKGKVVIHIREPIAEGYFGLRRIFIRSQIKKYADHVIAISKDNALRLNLPGRLSVVYNFSEINENPVNIQDVEGKVALYVGGDSLIKGYLTMVDALDYLDKDIQVWFCGYYGAKKSVDAAVSNKFKKIIFNLFPSHRRLQKAKEIMYSHSRAKVLGLRSDIPELLSKSLVLVSPFSVEHFSRPVVEAFANGRCAIGTNVEGMEELIDHGYNGILVERNNPVALALEINKLCSNLVLNESMAMVGYSKAKNIFSPTNVNAITKIYEKLLLNIN